MCRERIEQYGLLDCDFSLLEFTLYPFFVVFFESFCPRFDLFALEIGVLVNTMLQSPSDSHLPSFALLALNVVVAVSRTDQTLFDRIVQQSV